MRIALGIEYDGSRFLGWQTQPGGGGIQDAVESALAEIAGQPVSVMAAGRTDRGVHARGQVAHFDTDAARPASAWVRGVNAFLPDSVAVLWSVEVSSEFHARYGAVARTYRYELLNRPVRPALSAANVGWFHAPLDVPAMSEAARALVGEHDFSAFRAAECQANSPIRTLEQLDVARAPMALHDEIVVATAARSFLHHQVRAMVGTLMLAGCGRLSAEVVAEILASGEKRRCGPLAPAAGLTFVGVDYALGK
jgi:tRNA pseudouridine38-40 synthase